jgi:hydroxymethylpyrimidine pyrophosphatase-like HAD family hydrolase
MMKTFVIDIDDTIIKTDNKQCLNCGRKLYVNPKPIQKEIDLINRAAMLGHRIILFTGRNWDLYDLTIRELASLKISYDLLIMGKPQGVYIDKDSKKTMEGQI